ncbi:hypothetical protein [Sandarakinorhabdus sp.]|uniref:hypothetical protein n=1 Tax=Sandarakinorhabdus sp. TaxID=1916663 RepID=UPI00286E1FAF|nr:hypothetical protein [Sandarakinorhabdus sp.]
MALDIARLWEKLYPAAWKLARSADPIHDRIGEAFRGFRDLKGEEFGPEERIIYNEITQRMTKAGAIVENGAIIKGAVANTLSGMSENEACEIAESIFELFVQVAELHFKQR